MHEDLLKRHLELVIEANKTTNITRISTWDEGMLLHVQDSLIGLPELNDAPEGLVCGYRIGCGISGDTVGNRKREKDAPRRFSRQGKPLYLTVLLLNLDLSSVETYTGRIEDLAREHPGEFAVVTARALSRVSVLMEFASPLLLKKAAA